jgi:hypothetical protein
MQTRSSLSQAESAMNPYQPPLPPMRSSFEARTAAWSVLRDELSMLLAKLEYTKLMIRLSQRAQRAH